ncbi:MAG: DUF433 domain-containing protein [Vitreimonas sp.]
MSWCAGRDVRYTWRMPVVPGHPRIAIDADVVFGRPRIQGTRIGVDLILHKLAAGASIEWLLEGYPSLAREDVYATLEYAASQMERKAKPVAAE